MTQSVPRPKPHRPRVEGIFAILRIREKELLTLKGPCSNNNCRLHESHAGPCDERKKPNTVQE